MKWTPKDAWLCLCVAVATLTIHHLMNPHGATLDAPRGEQVTLTRTAHGWLLTSSGGATVKLSKVKVTHAENLD